MAELQGAQKHGGSWASSRKGGITVPGRQTPMSFRSGSVSLSLTAHEMLTVFFFFPFINETLKFAQHKQVTQSCNIIRGVER